MQKRKFLTNKQLLAEIHNCKTRFCSFVEPEYSEYDAIIYDLDVIDDDFLAEVARNKSSKITPKGAAPVDVPFDGLIFRYMTHDHVPLDPFRKRKSRVTDKNYAQTNFKPFKHFLYRGGELIEVGRSHWKGDLETGHFSTDHARLTNQMGRMILLLVERYGQGGSWRGYSYNEEMKGHATTHLCQIALQFDEDKSDNPFSWYTTSMKNCFRRILQIEKKQQNIRDELRQQAGEAPSISRQVDHELAMRADYQAATKPLPAKRGRKSAVEKAAMERAERDGTIL